MMSGDKTKTNLPGQAESAQVAEFIEKVAAMPTVRSAAGAGRLMFAMDATASREPSWDQACHLQAEMFGATDGLGGLEVQLVFFRGYGECKSSPWVSTSAELVRRMTKVRCLGGRTQIGKVLRHAIREVERRRINAFVFVGDSFEEYGVNRLYDFKNCDAGKEVRYLRLENIGHGVTRSYSILFDEVWKFFKKF